MAGLNHYYVNEVPKRFDINLPKLKVLFDEQKITPYFYVDKIKIVIGGIDKNRTFIGYGTAEYQGLIAIQRSQFAKLWDSEKVDANFIILQNKNCITNYSSDNPFPVSLPNGIINSWQSTSLQELTRNRLIAVCMPEVKTEHLCYHIETFDDIDPNSPLDPETQTKVRKTTYRWLAHKLLNLNFSEILISEVELTNSGEIKNCAV